VVAGRGGRDLEKLLGKNPGTVSRWLTEAIRRSLHDSSYRAHLDIFDSRIRKFTNPEVMK
jgi:hypothetical protein